MHIDISYIDMCVKVFYGNSGVYLCKMIDCGFRLPGERR